MPPSESVLETLTMEKTQQEIRCSICDKRVTLQEDTCADENGKAVHTDCYAKRILQDQDNDRHSGTAA
jgi:hypothetical protein